MSDTALKDADLPANEPFTSKDGLLPDQNSTTEVNRANLIDLAVKFLNNPRVQSSPMEQKRAFLKKKGLTDAEIEKSISMVNHSPPMSASATNQIVPKSMVAPPLPPRPPPPWRTRSWGEYAVMAVVLGGMGYAAVQFYKVIPLGGKKFWRSKKISLKRYVLPWLERPSVTEQRLQELQTTMEEVQSNLSQSVATLNESTKAIRDVLSEQQHQMQLLTSTVSQQRGGEHSMREVKDELTSLKGLLLNRHQFPPTPTRPGSSAGGGATIGGGIPSWQRVQPAQKTGLTNGTTEKPPNDQTSGSANSSPDGDRVREKETVNGGPPVFGKLKSNDEDTQEWHDAPN